VWHSWRRSRSGSARASGRVAAHPYSQRELDMARVVRTHPPPDDRVDREVRQRHRHGSQTDPYLLVREVPGFGFKRVDIIARKMGTPRSTYLVSAPASSTAFAERLDQGDCWVDYEQLVELANALSPWTSPTAANGSSRHSTLLSMKARSLPVDQRPVSRGATADPRDGVRTRSGFTERRRPNPHFRGETDEALLAGSPSLTRLSASHFSWPRIITSHW